MARAASKESAESVPEVGPDGGPRVSEGNPAFNVLDSLDKRVGALQRTVEEEMLALRSTQKEIFDEIALVARLVQKGANPHHPWSQLDRHGAASMSNPRPGEIRTFGEASLAVRPAPSPMSLSLVPSSSVAASSNGRHPRLLHSDTNVTGDGDPNMDQDHEPQGHSSPGGPRRNRSMRSENGRVSRGPAGVSQSMSAWNFGLPPSWPRCIRMRNELKGSVDAKEHIAVVATLARQISEFTETEHKHKERMKMLDPDSYPMIIWDALSLVFLINDLFITPYVMVMDVKDSDELKVFGLLAALYWTVDFLFGFNVGYYKKGELQRKRKQVIMHYLKRWMLPNLFILIFDWLAIFFQFAESSNAESSALLQFKVMRVLKVFRLIKFFRLARLIKLMDKFSGYVSRGTKTVVQVCKIAFFVLIYNHILSCFWCWLGQQDTTNTGNHWLDHEASLGGSGIEGGQVKRFRELGDMYIYISAFHWTVAQMTPGPINVVAVNMFEKVFNILLLLFGLFFVSIIVSLMSGQVMQLIISQRDMQDKLDKLEHFLRQSKVPRSLAVRVQRQVLDRLGVGTPIKEEDVVALRLLSSGLRGELLYESRKQYLFLHPLFEMWHQIDMGTFRQLCTDAMQLMYLSSEDELFAPEQEAVCAYVLNSGRMSYLQTPESSKAEDLLSIEVLVKVWFCEAALWSNWVHVGRVEARSACHVIAVEAKAVLAAVEKKAAVAFAVKQYGRNFHVRIISSVPPDASYPNDLHVPNTDIGDLAPQYVGIGLFKSALNRGKLQISQMGQDLLEEELRKEKSTLQQNASGDLQRIVAVVALRLVRDGRFVLVQVAKWKQFSEDLSVGAELPGSKRVLGELPHKALQRVIDGDLAPLAKGIVLEGSEQDSFTRDSPKFGMRTTYLRTVHDAMFAENILVEELPTVAEIELEGATHTVFGIGGPKEIRLYTWLPQSLLNWCQDGDGAQLLKEEIEKLDVDEVCRHFHVHAADEGNASEHSSYHEYGSDRRPKLRGGGLGLDDATKIQNMPSDGELSNPPVFNSGVFGTDEKFGSIDKTDKSPTKQGILCKDGKRPSGEGTRNMLHFTASSQLSGGVNNGSKVVTEEL
mmetsp:Transcript_16270/g.37547  ORF Transcript_16270/g.37547 Transcript_16270/m.37547 type:complete len:1099 (-) Transcript_16270:264-3560(-)